MNLSKELKKKRDAEDRLRSSSPTKIYSDGKGYIDLSELAAKDHKHKFIDLTDAPADYADMAGKVVKVNSLENGLEFGEDGGGGESVTVPSYLVDNMNTKAELVRKLQNENTLTIAFLPDLHHSSTLPSNDSALKILNEIEKNVDIKLYISGGDQLFSQNTTKQQALDNLTDLIKKIDKKEKFLPCVGNHDNNRDNDDTRMITPSELYGRIYKQIEDNAVFDSTNKAGGYYYYDIVSNKVRVVVLNTMDLPYDLYNGSDLKYTPNTTYAISNEQLDFVANFALDFSAKGDKTEWKVLFVSHAPLLDEADLDSSYITNVINKDVMIGIISAFRDGISYTSTPTTGDFAQSISIDFTSQGEMNVICFLFGHYHFDQIIFKNDFYHISSLPVHYFTDGMPSIPRTVGTVNEIAMDIITFNLNTKDINMTRFGANIDRLISEIEVLTYINILRNGNFEETELDKWFVLNGNGTFSVVNGEGVFLVTSRYTYIWKTAIPRTIIGHKYYMATQVKSISSSVYLGSGTLKAYHSGSNNYELLDGILTATSDLHGFSIHDDSPSAWGNIYFKESRIIDLTEKFGAGSEPSVGECRLLFPEYSQSVLARKNMASTHPTTWVQGTFDTSNGALLGSTTRIRTINAIIVEPNTTYTIFLQNFANYNFVLYAYDANGDYILSASLISWQTAIKVYTTASNCKYLRFGIKKVTDATIVTSDIDNAKLQLELGSTATAYEQ